jgi:hypothetical protein
MCFSAEASFAASAVLLPAGIYSTRAALRLRRAYLPLALIPLVFSFQQFAEGVVWVALAQENTALVAVGSLSFLAVALLFWPFWVPFSFLFLENRKKRKRILAAIAVFGLAFGCALYFPLALNTEEWLHVGVVSHSIRYNLKGLPVFEIVSRVWWDACYGAIVFSPFLIPSLDKRFALFCILLAGSAALSFLVFSNVFVSVWCFFAALLSLQLCYIFHKLREPQGRSLEIEVARTNTY